MAIDPDYARGELVKTLLAKVDEDPYPSSTMLDMLEQLLTDEEMPAYVVFLQERIRRDRFPSIPMIQRLVALV